MILDVSTKEFKNFGLKSLNNYSFFCPNYDNRICFVKHESHLLLIDLDNKQ